MKAISIVGARPQFIKLAPISKELQDNGIDEIIIHTGQHYDTNMSGVFFEQLGINTPKYNLNVGSMNHGAQTGMMLSELEKIYIKEEPDFVIVFGDTNSTLAGALAASKLLIPIVHIEAGLRSFNKKMPEEQNRILTDHLSSFLFTTSEVANENLAKENIKENVYNVGDLMYDIHLDTQSKISNEFSNYELDSKSYILATLHRAENTNYKERLSSIVNAFNNSGEKIVLPLHPRTKKYMSEYGLSFSDNVMLIEPVNYFEMVALQVNSKLILTDSGGVQKEAYFAKVPCITMRDETEWTETIEVGANVIVGADENLIIDNMNKVSNFDSFDVELYGDGFAARKIVKIILGEVFNDEK